MGFLQVMLALDQVKIEKVKMKGMLGTTKVPRAHQ